MKLSKGFTLIELVIVMLVVGIIAIYTTPNFIEDLRERRTNITIAEVNQITSAAQNWVSDNGTWPDQANNCVDAIAIMVGVGGYIDNIDSFSPWYDAAVNPGGAYITSCTPTNFSLSVTTDPEWAGAVANSLPATSIIGPSTITSVPLPSSIPALDALLPRDGSRAMTGNLDLGTNDINNVNTVNATKLVSTVSVDTPLLVDTDNPVFRLDPSLNSKLAQVVVDDVCLASGTCLSDLKAATDNIVADGSLITKPICTTGIPQIFANPVSFSKDAVGDAIGAVQVYASNFSATQWQVFLRILTKDGFFSPTFDYGKIHVVTRCQ